MQADIIVPNEYKKNMLGASDYFVFLFYVILFQKF